MYGKFKMANNKVIDTTAVAISTKAADLAKVEKDRRFEETGVKMTIGAIVSEAVFKTYGQQA